MAGFAGKAGAGAGCTYGGAGGRAGGSRVDLAAGSAEWTWFRAFRAEMNKELAWKGSLSALVGALLGAACAVVVNCTLVELSASALFAAYLGLVFVAVGAVLLWRIQATGGGPRKQQLALFAALVLASGLLCLLLRRNWFLGLHPLLKVPAYTALGVSVAFALAFSLVDVVNCCFACCQPAAAPPLLQSPQQAQLVLLFALALGGLFGGLFGLLDLPDETLYQLRLALQREQLLCLPPGALLGALAGFCNELLRHQQRRLSCYSPEFDEDI